MSNLAKRIEIIANISITFTALLLNVVLVKSYLLPTSPNPIPTPAPLITDNQLQKGTKVSLQDIDWQKNRSTLLIALSTTCHFCTESAPFYQRLVKERGNTRLIALVPQTANEGQSYLTSLDVKVDDVKQVSLSTIGLRGTPTLILVDREGRITDLWIGLLSRDSENEVLNRLATERASN